MKFVEVISGWINRYFSNEEAIFLVVFMIAVLLVLIFLGGVLAPILTGLAFAFLLHGVVDRLVAWRVPRLVAVGLVELLFLGLLIAMVVGILPLVWRQLRDLVEGLPSFLDRPEGSRRRLHRTVPGVLPRDRDDRLGQLRRTGDRSWRRHRAGRVHPALQRARRDDLRRAGCRWRCSSSSRTAIESSRRSRPCFPASVVC